MNGKKVTHACRTVPRIARSHSSSGPTGRAGEGRLSKISGLAVDVSWASSRSSREAPRRHRVPHGKRTEVLVFGNAKAGMPLMQAMDHTGSSRATGIRRLFGLRSMIQPEPIAGVPRLLGSAQDKTGFGDGATDIRPVGFVVCSRLPAICFIRASSTSSSCSCRGEAWHGRSRGASGR